MKFLSCWCYLSSHSLPSPWPCRGWRRPCQWNWTCLLPTVAALAPSRTPDVIRWKYKWHNILLQKPKVRTERVLCLCNNFHHRPSLRACGGCCCRVSTVWGGGRCRCRCPRCPRPWWSHSSPHLASEITFHISHVWLRSRAGEFVIGNY